MNHTQQINLFNNNFTDKNEYICDNCGALIAATTTVNRSISTCSYQSLGYSAVCNNKLNSDAFLGPLLNEQLDIYPVQSMAPSSTNPYVVTTFIKCPSCSYINIFATVYLESDSYKVPLLPKSRSTTYGAEHLPPEIRKDYQEAFSIVELSPRASATLARRCLQGMIRSKFDVAGAKGNLNSEINLISENISTHENKVLTSIRQLGNIGAHPEKDEIIVDISIDEAKTLLQCIEYFIKTWFIDPAENEKLFNSIEDINKTKQ